MINNRYLQGPQCNVAAGCYYSQSLYWESSDGESESDRTTNVTIHQSLRGCRIGFTTSWWCPSLLKISETGGSTEVGQSGFVKSSLSSFDTLQHCVSCSTRPTLAEMEQSLSKSTWLCVMNMGLSWQMNISMMSSQSPMTMERLRNTSIDNLYIAAF